MTEEEKGFVIKDRRAFDEKGARKEGAAHAKQTEKGGAREGQGKMDDRSSARREEAMPLPEVNFSSLIFSLSYSALFHLGETADPQGGEKKKDLPLAKHAIDTIAMLKDKTRGNLTEEEQRFLDNILMDLRLKFVKAKE